MTAKSNNIIEINEDPFAEMRETPALKQKPKPNRASNKPRPQNTRDRTADEAEPLDKAEARAKGGRRQMAKREATVRKTQRQKTSPKAVAEAEAKVDNVINAKRFDENIATAVDLIKGLTWGRSNLLPVDMAGQIAEAIKLLETEYGIIRDLVASGEVDLGGDLYTAKITNTSADRIDQKKLMAELGPDLSPYKTTTPFVRVSIKRKPGK